MKKIIKKLKDRAGLTLTEMLVTVAILSLFSAACLTGMTTALSVRRDNIMANDAEILTSLVIEMVSSDLRTASNIRKADNSPFVAGDDGKKFDSIRYQCNEPPHYFNDGELKLNDEKGQLVWLYHERKADETLENEKDVFSEGVYSDKEVKQLILKNLKFIPGFEDGKMTTVTVTFEIGYKNVDSKDTVNIPTAHTVFTVRLMNAGQDKSSHTADDPDPGS